MSALHVQQQVLDAVVAAIVAGSTRAGSDVHLDLADGLPAAKLPAVRVEEDPEGETSEPFTIHSHDMRTLNVVVRCELALTADNAAQTRAFGLEVEKAIAGNAALKALCKTRRINSSRLEKSTEGERTFAARVQDWKFTYIVHPTAPETAL